MVYELRKISQINNRYVFKLSIQTPEIGANPSTHLLEIQVFSSSRDFSEARTRMG